MRACVRACVREHVHVCVCVWRVCVCVWCMCVVCHHVQGSHPWPVAVWEQETESEQLTLAGHVSMVLQGECALN